MTDMELIRGNRKVGLYDIGEGWNGDYDPNDPNDEALLRFDIYELVNGEWEPLPDASYCTAIPVSTHPATIRLALEIIMKETAERDNVKKVAERLSWLTV